MLAAPRPAREKDETLPNTPYKHSYLRGGMWDVGQREQKDPGWNGLVSRVLYRVESMVTGIMPRRFAF